MIIQQLTVFLENRPGTMAEVTALLAKDGIDTRALSLADTSDFGILRMIVNDPDRAINLLKKAGFTVALTGVIAVGVSDEPGEFAQIVRVMSDAGVNIEYLYAFVGRCADQAVIIFRVDQPDACITVLQKEGVNLLSPKDVYHL